MIKQTLFSYLILNTVGASLALAQEVTQNFTHKGYRLSNRIQLCATPLLAVLTPEMIPKAGTRLGYLISNTPINHIAIEVDGREIYSPGGGGMDLARTRGYQVNCYPLEIPESAQEERVASLLNCTANTFSNIAHYDLIGYNCGGFAADILKAAGIKIPPWLPSQNFRIGIEEPTNPLTFEQRWSDKKNLFTEILPNCMPQAPALNPATTTKILVPL